MPSAVGDRSHRLRTSQRWNSSLCLDKGAPLPPPWVCVFDHRAKDLSVELEAVFSRFQHDIVNTDAKSRLAAFLDNCSFEHGAQQLRILYERLMN